MTEANTPSSQSTLRGRSRAALPWVVGGVAFVVLAAAIAYVGSRPAPRAPVPDLTPITQQLAGVRSGIGQLKAGLGAMEGKVASLDQRFARLPPPPPIAPLERRLAALDARLTALATARSKTPPPASRPSEPSSARMDADARAALAPLRARVAALEKSVEKADQSARARDAQEKAAQVTREKAVKGIEASVSDLLQSQREFTDRIASLTRLAQGAAAAAALNEGRPLGAIPDAPPALARYANAAPPTISSLRIALIEATRLQLSLEPSDEEHPGLLGQMRTRLGRLITIRDGNKILVGNPNAGVTAKAEAALRAGDLGGAVAILGALSPPLAPAMVAWLTEARDLLAARAALVSFGGAS